MNGQSEQDEFEALPFTAGETADEGETAGAWSGEGETGGAWSGEDETGEFEEEGGRMRMGGMGRGGMGRSGMGGGRPVYRAGGRPGRGAAGQPSRPSRPSRPGPRRWPRGPYWGPFHGWPGGVMVSEPMGYPLAAPPEAPAPAIEPIDLPADGGDDGDDVPQEEIPGTLAGVLRAMGADAPAFRRVGTLDQVHALRLPTGPGFYLITFRKGNAWRAYNGQTDNLHDRLLKHKLGATVLGFAVPRHHVYIAESPRPERARRTIEHAINRAMRQNHGGVLTNQRDELEMELLGWH